ncbi:MAG: PTS sugar transporter subunit IIB, partial [Longimicrobiales bacterium]|nr:PTS sugar transporter subunit IIB [Longimicrobiales bacterium]
RRSIVLFRDVATMRRLAEGGKLRGEKVNLGGVHHGPGREKVLRYLHLTEDDRRALEALADDGVDVSARELPDSPKVGLATLLGE